MHANARQLERQSCSGWHHTMGRRGYGDNPEASDHVLLTFDLLNPKSIGFDRLSRTTTMPSFSHSRSMSVLWIERLFWRRCATNEHRIPKIPRWRILSHKTGFIIALNVRVMILCVRYFCLCNSTMTAQLFATYACRKSSDSVRKLRMRVEDHFARICAAVMWYDIVCACVVRMCVSFLLPVCPCVCFTSCILPIHIIAIFFLIARK